MGSGAYGPSGSKGRALAFLCYRFVADLTQQLAAHGFGEIPVVGADLRERARAADDFAVECFEQVGFLVQDAEAVDRDAFGDEGVADGGGGGAVVGAAVAGDVDQAARGVRRGP